MKINITKRKSIALAAIFFVLAAGVLYLRLFGPLFPAFGKGGIGVVDNGSYVLTATKVNSARCGNLNWIGKAYTENETLVCSNSGGIEFNLTKLFGVDPILRFTPERIYIFELRTFEGGYYRRNFDPLAVIENGPNKNYPVGYPLPK